MIDSYFFSCLDADFIRSVAGQGTALGAEHDLGLFVVDDDSAGRLAVIDKIPVMLDVFMRALDSSREMNRDEFMASLNAAMNNPERSIKIAP